MISQRFSIPQLGFSKFYCWGWFYNQFIIGVGKTHSEAIKDALMKLFVARGNSLIKDYNA